MILVEAVAKAVCDAAVGNSHTSVSPCAILWPDKESVWAGAMDRIASELPTLVTLDAFDPSERRGPAIWLKCVVAGVLEDFPHGDAPPILYLPGVGRSELRAIESCPRDLQPLAELQYRGVFWSQANGKDWTLAAFLASKNGGLGLDVAQDRATQDALARALEAGVLLDRPVDELRARRIDGPWLDSLLAPNPTRDVLVWMDDPANAQSRWGAGRWSVFTKRCKADLGFDPVADGVLVAGERLAQAKGLWEPIWELYKDSYGSFPRIAELLQKLQPPNNGLFVELASLAGYPRANQEAESALRYKLSACGAMPPEQARDALIELETEHACRRAWVWARMGRAPLAESLEHLSALSAAAANALSGTTLTQLADSYRNMAWQVDLGALRAMAAVHAKADADAVAAALRAVYVPWLEDGARRFQAATKAAGRLGIRPGSSGNAAQQKGLCIVFVDGLRYDVATVLRATLESIGKADLSAEWTSLPSVTASGKAWCSPVAHLIQGTDTDQDFEPRVAADGKPLSAYNFRKLLTEQGLQILDKDDFGDPNGRAWTECGDLDHFGHANGMRLARDMDAQLAIVVERVMSLHEAGWRRFRIVTDHGWLLVPGGLPKTELAKFETVTRWGRCAVLKSSAHGTPLTFGWDWCSGVQVAYAPGISSFVGGLEYAHGGLTLQECLVPVIEVEANGETTGQPDITIADVVWKGLRCIVRVEPAISGLSVDIRTKAAQASSTLAAGVKAVEDGQANLAISDDDHIGLVAIVVVLDADGNVLQKVTTTVGG